MPIRPLGKAVYQVSREERTAIQDSLKKGENLPQVANPLNYPLALNRVSQALKRNPKDAELLELRAEIYLGSAMPELEKQNLPLSDLTHLAKLIKLGVRDLSNSSLEAKESEAITQLKIFINSVSNMIIERVAGDQIRAKVLQTAGAENKAELADTTKKIFDDALKAIGLATEPTAVMHNLVGTYGLAYIRRTEENISALERARILALGLKHTEIAETKFTDNSDPYFDITCGYYAKDQINNFKEELLPLEIRRKSFSLMNLSQESYREGNYSKALEEIDQSIELNPYNYSLLEFRGRIKASKLLASNTLDSNSQIIKLIESAIEDYVKAKSFVLPNSQDFESCEKSIASLKETLHFKRSLENSIKERRAIYLSKSGNFPDALKLARECFKYDHERYEGYNVLANVILSELGIRYKTNSLECQLLRDSVELTKEGFNAVERALQLFPPKDTENIYSQQDIAEVRSHLKFMQENFLFLKGLLKIQ